MSAAFLTMTLGGSVLALVLLAGKGLFRRLPSAVYYYAWLVVLLRFLLPLPGLVDTSREQVQPDAARPVEEVTTYQNRTVNTYPVLPPQVDTRQETEENLPDVSPVRQEIPWKLLLGAAWAVGFAASICWYGLSYRRFAESFQANIRGEMSWQGQGFAGEGKKPRILLVDGIESPMLLGLIRPDIVLPYGKYDAPMLENILRHELVHYRRRDILYKWFSVLVFSVQWFNPLVILMRREIDLACERSCDEQVIRHMTASQKQAYGESLLYMAAQGKLSSAVLATTFSTQKQELKERLLGIMHFRLDRKGMLAGAAVLLTVVACALLLGPKRHIFPPLDLGEGWGQRKIVTVSNVDEFLDAIGSDREIRMKKGEYRLDRAADYGKESSNPGYRWEEVYDGYQLVIENVENLVIRGQDGEKTELLAKPRYAGVLNFTGSENIYIQGLTAGHAVEQGTCTGDVLAFRECSGVQVEESALFGCGAVAIRAEQCKDLKVTQSSLYECSYNAVVAWQCEELTVADCRIYNMDCLDALFSLAYNQAVLIRNCLIENNTAAFFLQASGTWEVTLEENTVKNNVFNQAVFLLDEKVTVKGGSFENNTAPQCYHPDSVKAVDDQGAYWMPGLSQRRVTVSTVDELLSQIHTDTVIVLQPGYYDLSAATHYGTGASLYYRWEPVFDGYQLVITAEDLVLLGGEGVELVTKPRYANVLVFSGCRDIRLENVILGHMPEKGVCTGNVVQALDCSRLQLLNCQLYGCGAVGFVGQGSEELELTNCAITDCSTGGVDFRESASCQVEGCNFLRIAEDSENAGYVFRATSCDGLKIRKNVINNCRTEYLFYASGVYESEFSANHVKRNTFRRGFRVDTGGIVVDGCVFSGNTVQGWFEENLSLPVDAQREPLTEEMLEQMGLEPETEIRNPVAQTEPSVPLPDEDGVYRVDTVDEFLAALGSNRTIVLTQQSYALKDASDYGRHHAGGAYTWETTWDGSQLVLQELNNLTIRVEQQSCCIEASARYATVLVLRGCTDISLENLWLGHSPEKGTCSGNVLNWEESENLTLTGCHLYGCGMTGLYAWRSTGLYAENTRFFSCSAKGAELEYSQNLTFRQCGFTQNGGFGLVLEHCRGVFAEENLFEENEEMDMCLSVCYEIYVEKEEFSDGAYRYLDGEWTQDF